MIVIVEQSPLERSLNAERVKSGMRRARLEGRQIGRARLDVDREQIVQDRRSGMSLTQVAKKHAISRASVCRLMKEANRDRSLAIAISDETSRVTSRTPAANQILCGERPARELKLETSRDKTTGDNAAALED